MYRNLENYIKENKGKLGKKCIIFGNSESVNIFDKRSNIFTIGVNNIGAYYNTDILMVVDSVSTFKRLQDPTRLNQIYNSKHSINIIKDEKWNFPYENTYQMKFGPYSTLNNLDDDNIIDTGHDSPYMAIQLAYKLGFTYIGILGVDYNDNHFYKKDGTHSLVKHNMFDQIYELYRNLNCELIKKKVNLFNLSPTSRIECIQKIGINSFKHIN
jgi:hypothetical protein